MKKIASEGFNKEKLAFIGTAALLALALYHLLISAPVELVPSEPVSNTPPPGPLDREKADTRVADVRFYLQEGLINPQTGLAVNRSRKNPFEPLDDFIVRNIPVPTPGPTGVKPVMVEPPPEQPVAKPAEKEDKKKEFTEKDKFAKVDFSGVMTMNGVTYGLLKSKSGETFQVKEGDYLEDFQYTVAKIEKQAIWVSDEDNQLFLARDTTFDVGGSGGGDEGDEKAAKKKPAAPKPTAAATPKPTPKPKPAPQVAQNNNNQRNNQRGNNSRNNRGGNGNNGNYQNFANNNPFNNNGNNRGGY